MKRVLFILVIAVTVGFLPGIQHAAYADILCGDVNGDGYTYTVGDMVYLARYIMGNAPALAPLENSDVDLCGDVNVSDLAIYLEYFVYGLPSGICTPQDDCSPSSDGYWISIDCPVEIPFGDWDSVPFPIYITNASDLAAISLGLSYDYDNMSITSVAFDGSVLPPDWQIHVIFPTDTSYIWPVDDSNFVYMVFFWEGDGSVEYLGPQEHGLLATLWLDVPGNVQYQEVDIDTVFVMPAGDFIFSPTSHGTLRPDFDDCFQFDIVIGAYVCGDADYSGAVDVDDVLFMLGCIFGDCSEEHLDRLDLNCSSAFDIDDIVYLLVYIFNHGPSPCDPNDDNIPDC